MAIALFEKDPFVEATEAEYQRVLEGKQKMDGVRRPLGGLVRDKDTYANLSVVSRDENNVATYWDLLDQGSLTGGTKTWSNFLIQSVQEQRMEKAQIVQTFGENFYFFFGEEPRFLMVSGVVFASDNFRWASEFRYNYENFLRGTRCAETRSRVILEYDKIVAQGMLISMSLDKNAMEPHAVPLVFNFAVLDFRDGDVPLDQTRNLIADTDFLTYKSKTANIRGSGEGFRKAAESLEPIDVAYADEKTNFIRQSNTNSLSPNTGSDGQSGTDPNQPYSYTDNGKLSLRSRAKGRSSGQELLSFAGRDRALLELDLLMVQGQLPVEDIKEARFLQRRNGPTFLKDRDSESLRTILTPGKVGSASMKV